MPRQVLTITPDGNVNRRDPWSELSPNEVRSRENFLVIGAGKTKVNKKMAGSERFTDGDISDKYTWIGNYYSGSMSKLYAFNGGNLYHISENGAETLINSTFEPTAYPVSVTTLVGSTNTMFFSDGTNGLWAYDGTPSNTFNKKDATALNFVGMAVHVNRLWGFEEDSETLYGSKILDFPNFTDADDSIAIIIGGKRGDRIMSIKILFETLFIFKQDSIWVLEGRSTFSFQVREIHPFLGTAARHSVVNVEQGIMFLGSDFEFYTFGGSHQSTQIESYNMGFGGDFTKDLNPLINRNTAALAQVTAVFHNHMYRCSFIENGKTVNMMEYIFNTINQTDGLTRGNNISIYLVRDKLPDKRELLTGRSDEGLIMKQYQELNYDAGQSGASMSAKLETASIGKDIRNKRFTKVWADFTVLGAHDLNLKYNLDTMDRDSTRAAENMSTQGNQVTVAGINLNNQTDVTSRGIIKGGTGKGQSIHFAIDQNIASRDISISAIHVEVILRDKKLSKFVGV